MGSMQEFADTSTLFGSNAPFIEQLYESYLADPASVSDEWRRYFDELRGDAADVPHAAVVESFRELARNRRVVGAMVDETTMHKQVLVLRLISKFRTLGVFHADLDPLKRQEPPYIPDLDLRTYGFTDADLDTSFDVGSFKAGPARMRGGSAARRSAARSQPAARRSRSPATHHEARATSPPMPRQTRRLLSPAA